LEKEIDELIKKRAQLNKDGKTKESEAISRDIRNKQEVKDSKLKRYETLIGASAKASGASSLKGLESYVKYAGANQEELKKSNEQF
jgi:hypothetical protein